MSFPATAKSGPGPGWIGANAGGVIVADRFTTNGLVAVPSLLGDNTVTVSTEGLSLGAQAGLDYIHIPVAGRPSPAQVEAMRTAVSGASGKVLAYCRSGTRSITIWALGSDQPRETVLSLSRAAGYDLSGMLL